MVCQDAPQEGRQIKQLVLELATIQIICYLLIMETTGAFS